MVVVGPYSIATLRREALSTGCSSSAPILGRGHRCRASHTGRLCNPASPLQHADRPLLSWTPHAPTSHLLSPPKWRASRTIQRPVAPPAASAGVIQALEATFVSSGLDELTPQQESLLLLEWPSICRQVASFCGTSMGAEKVLAGELPIGSSQQESELLLQQTEEAQVAGLKIKGVYDLRPLLDGISMGGACNPLQLEGIASSLESALTARAAACQPAATARAAATTSSSSSSSHHRMSAGPQAARGQQQHPTHQQQQQYKYPGLAVLAQGILEEERGTLELIRACIRQGSIIDEASPRLAEVRQSRRTNLEAVRSLVGQLARQLYSQGAAEGKEPVVVRGRQAVAVKAGQKGALTKGSVKLGASGSGATLYVEPVEAAELNNLEAGLADEEAAEERAVLVGLSRQLQGRQQQLRQLLEAVAALDVVSARAGHAEWLGGVRPHFVSRYAVEPTSPLNVPTALHPVLLEPALPPLPRPPSAEDVTPDLIQAPAWATAAGSSRSSSSRAREAGGVRGPGPKALQLQVPPGTKVVAVTGPNTGGKTVTLKTAGLMALMAKAGLFLPLDINEEDILGEQNSTSKDSSSSSSSSGSDGFMFPSPSASSSPLVRAAAAGTAIAGSSSSSSSSSTLKGGAGSISSPSPPSSSSAAAGAAGAAGPSLFWFDQVLVDIGDAQSLQQSLSTFSGHVRRLRRVLGAVTPLSLVLLDEVGSGTDPQEGAALARAVLDRLADSSGLTIATTHHAELKSVPEEDGRFVNVSMEFDTASLRPTYHLCWGSAGSSNALDIAAALGFDIKVVEDARALLAAEAARQQQQRDRMTEVAENVEQQLEQLQEQLQALRQERQQEEGVLQLLGQQVAELSQRRRLLRGAPAKIQEEAARMTLELQVAMLEARRGAKSLVDLEVVFQRWQQKVPEEVVKPFKKGDPVNVTEMGSWGNGLVSKVVGDRVYVDVASAVWGGGPKVVSAGELTHGWLQV